MGYNLTFFQLLSFETILKKDVDNKYIYLIMMLLVFICDVRSWSICNLVGKKSK